MNWFNIVAGLASIISIPLAIYFSRRTSDAKSEKARLDIIKTLSFRLATTHKIEYDDFISVYKSKLRDHKISKPKFSMEDILNDLKTDIISNAFLEGTDRKEIMLMLQKLDFSKRLPIPKSYRKLFRVFLSPLPGILLIASIVFNFALLFPYALIILRRKNLYSQYKFDFLSYFSDAILDNAILLTGLIVMFALIVIYIARHIFIKQYFNRL